MLMEGGQVAGMRKHPYGRVDQLEDRYLGMVEAPSSNLGTSTLKKAHSKRVRKIQSPLLIVSNTELIDSSGALFMCELTQPEPDEKDGKCGE